MEDGEDPATVELLQDQVILTTGRRPGFGSPVVFLVRSDSIGAKIG